MRLKEFFSRHPVFTVAELDEFLAQRGTRSRWTRHALLAQHRKRGHVVSVRRGLYVTVPDGAKPSTCPVDPYLLSAKMTEDAVLAYHTALEFYGKAYSVYNRFYYLTGSTSLSVTFRSFEFRCALFPKPLRDKKEEDFGVDVLERAGVDVRVTSLERTLVDGLDRPDLSGSWEEIWRSLEMVEFFDLDEVAEYALLLDNATTTAKVGFFLEQHREPLMVEDAHLKPLRELRPRGPRYLVRSKRTPGRLVAGWNLVVPEALLARTWAEVT